MTTPISLTFPVASFRHLDTPFTSKGIKNYYAVVEASELPDLDDWRQTNVRDPKLRGAVPKAIREGFQDHPDLFLFMNRGIVIAAQSVTYDNKSEKVTISLKNPKLHGLLDGGHSYKIIKEEAGNDDQPRYVKVELLEGFGHDDLINVVDARNTSNQVKDESLLNLDDKFDGLKDALKSSHYYDNIAWKEYEVDAEGTPKPIDVREIIAILTVFDKDHYDDTAHPILAYSSKTACLKHFKDHPKSYEKLYPIADQLLRLHDHVYMNLRRLYNEGRGLSGDVGSGRFGKLTGVTVYKGKKRARLYFLDEESELGIPSGFIYPMLAAFRAMLVDHDGLYKWAKGVNPPKLIEGDLGIKLATVVGNAAREDQNPSKTGKSQNVWQGCYVNAENAYLRIVNK